MTTGEFNAIIDKINDCLEQYNRMTFDTNQQILYLANGEMLNIMIPKNHIAHLLGVNIDYLRQSGLFKAATNSYDSLHYFLENSYQFSRLISSGKLDSNSIFSKNIHEKLDSFLSNIKIRTDDLIFVIKYDRERTYQVEETAEVCDYYIVRKISSSSYGILGLVKSPTVDFIYWPVTSRKYDDYSEFDHYISRIAFKQDLTYPYHMKINNRNANYTNSIKVSLNDKIDALKRVINFAKKYDATPSTSSDYFFSINKTKANLEAKQTDSNVLSFLVDTIVGGDILDINTISEVVGEVELSEDIRKLIDACNNLICSKAHINMESVQSNYSVLEHENQSLKEKLQSLKAQLIEVDAARKQLEEENVSLLEQKNAFSEQFQVIEQACQKMRSLK